MITSGIVRRLAPFFLANTCGKHKYNSRCKQTISHDFIGKHFNFADANHRDVPKGPTGQVVGRTSM